MHGYKWPINCTRTRIADVPATIRRDMQGWDVTGKRDHAPTQQRRREDHSQIIRRHFCDLRVNPLQKSDQFAQQRLRIGPERAHCILHGRDDPTVRCVRN